MKPLYVALLLGCTEEAKPPGDAPVDTATGATQAGQADAPPDRWQDVDVSVCADGSADFADLQEAIDASPRGSTIGVCPGTWGPIQVLWAQEVRIVAVDGPQVTTIDGGTGVAIEVEEGVLDLSGFTITGAGIYDPWYPKGAITVFEGNLTLSNSIVERTTGPFSLLYDEDHLELHDVLWRDNTTDWLWYLWQGDDDAPEPGTAIITGNVVNGGTHFAIVETARLHSMDLTNNVFANVTMDTAVSAFILRWRDRPLEPGTLNVSNNVFYNIDDLDPWGGRLFDAGGSVSFRNNIVVDCDAWNLKPMQSSYSLFWNNAVDYSEVVVGEENLFVDPMLEDPASLDFRLQPGSPAIDAGDPSPEFQDPDGTRNDLGIYGGPAASS